MSSAFDTIGDLSLAEMLQHVANQPVDAKRIKGLAGAVITGQVGSGATIVAGSGWTVASGGTGLYTITFTTPFAVNPTVIVTPILTSANSRIAQIFNLATGSVDVYTHNDSNTLVNTDFHFVAYTTV